MGPYKQRDCGINGGVLYFDLQQGGRTGVGGIQIDVPGKYLREKRKKQVNIIRRWGTISSRRPNRGGGRSHFCVWHLTFNFDTCGCVFTTGLMESSNVPCVRNPSVLGCGVFCVWQCEKSVPLALHVGSESTIHTLSPCAYACYVRATVEPPERCYSSQCCQKFPNTNQNTKTSPIKSG